MATRKVPENDISLPFASLQLLAPPVRLMSAALWKVMKQRDVMEYGVVEEFVTSACESIPGLLTLRHQGKLALGLRARLILELCCKQPDEKVIMSHLERIRAPSSSSDHTVKKDLKIQKTVESFHLLVGTLLKDPAEREQFFKEEFPVDYGPVFDQELEKLLWEFLIRLDQLLPVPNLRQTVSWLSEAAPVLEECARSATQPQLLKLLLHHQNCLRPLDPAGSLPPNMGDSILASLSLQPSGRVASDQPAGAKRSSVDPSHDTQTRDKIPRITPVTGTSSYITGASSPVMISSSKRTQSGDSVTKLNLKFTPIKQREDSQSSTKDGARTVRKEACDRAALETSMTKMGVKSLPLPEDPSLCSVFVTCLHSQPRIVLDRLPETFTGANSFRGERSKYSTHQKRSRPSPAPKTTRNQPGTDFPALDNKENQPVLGTSSSPSQQRSIYGDGEDYVADSEDEATKNFKGRLFTRRYYKTKHGTYVPTLREFWKPGMWRRDLLSACSKPR